MSISITRAAKVAMAKSPFVCVEALSAGDVLCHSKTSTNEVLKAQADDEDRMPAFSIAAEEGSIGDEIDVTTTGYSPTINRTEDFDLQEPIYVSTTAGKATKTPPDESGCGQQRIGIARGLGSAILSFDLTVMWVG